ncbi:hypothetical protein J8273_5541 [Carpediemonas membranifera]|uniref:Uncharacterized protein n=1 Tax=Carpediemonas membranifera TaxID=201153 RepID=A0A8J6ARL8_9EUKA|nr:hypothetical protein J8273_5541 [Carpediemonas membranifera]|eukprot:KAG9392536.1 hypothetical protein J8273_5541 [Carpediemonas membranifera]
MTSQRPTGKKPSSKKNRTPETKPVRTKRNEVLRMIENAAIIVEQEQNVLPPPKKHETKSDSTKPIRAPKGKAASLSFLAPIGPATPPPYAPFSHLLPFTPLDVEALELRESLNPSNIERSAWMSAEQDARRCATTIWPGMWLSRFGSVSTGIQRSGDDLDLCCVIPSGQNSEPTRAAFVNALSVSGFTIKSTTKDKIHAKSRIGVSVDIYLRLPAAVDPLVPTSSFIERLTAGPDPRPRDLIVLVREWAERAKLTGEGGVSKVVLDCLVVAFLQRLDVTVLPVPQDKALLDQSPRPVCWISTNTDGLHSLLAGFFKFLAKRELKTAVIDVTTEPLVERTELGFESNRGPICVRCPVSGVDMTADLPESWGSAWVKACRMADRKGRNLLTLLR